MAVLKEGATGALAGVGVYLSRGQGFGDRTDHSG
jgi:hypothetical protein